MLLFWVGFLLLAHTYVIFPNHMRNLAKKLPRWPLPPSSKDFPTVSILLAAYNEEKVMEEKIKSTLETSYPAEKITFYIGTDCCSDATDSIVERWASQDRRVKHFPFHERQGKPSIVNALAAQAEGEILVLTDADTYFQTDTLRNLIAPLVANSSIGGVQSAFHTKTEGGAVGIQETQYNDREMMLKAGESSRGAVIGAYGSGYAIRKTLFSPIPSGFVVDDFFLFMEILRKGFQCVLAQEALTELKVSGDSEVQYRRKVRISRGNWMNLLHFRTMLSPGFGFVAYAFWSHKALRWLGPWLLLAMLLGAASEATTSPFMKVAFLGQIVFYALAFIDQLLGLRLTWLRFIRHFVMMNLALLHGFFKFIRGEKQAWWNN